MPAHHIGESESLSSQLQDDVVFLTPIVLDGGCGARSYLRKINDNRMPMLQDQIADMATGNGLPVSDVIADDYARLKSELPEHDVLLPTPTLGHLRNHDEPVEDYLQRRQDFVEGRTKGMPGASLGVAVRMETLPTPKALDGVKGNLKTSQERLDSGRQVDLPNVAIDLMPTPAARDGKDGTVAHEREGAIQTDTVARAIFNSGEIQVLPTPLVDDAKNTGHNQTRIKTLASEVWETERTTNWGKFEPAIRRWEDLTRPAPAPTKPDGKDGNHRLSSAFTEWMMGLPDGWVTGHGLKRNDELKMCGNGVVPQQAELALRFLLGQIDSPKA
jgi:hypothetical protein